LGVEGPKDGEIKEKVKRDQAKSSSRTIKNRCIKDLGGNVISVRERSVTKRRTSLVHIQTNRETLTQSGGHWRASRFQRSSIASSSCQDEVVAAGGRRDGVVSEILGGLLRLLGGAGLFKICAVQGLTAIPNIEEHVSIGTLCDGASALAELGFVEACQSALANVLQLVQVNAWIP
jgi:hypothetical protein